MKNSIDITPVIELAITIISALITLYVIPYLRQRLSEEKFRRLSCAVSMAVKAAEQIYGSKTGQQKKEYVISYLKTKNIAFNPDEVEAMIESEVFKMNAECFSLARNAECRVQNAELRESNP